MMRELPAEPPEYGSGAITGERKQLFDALSVGFHNYICSKSYPVLVRDGNEINFVMVSVEENIKLVRAVAGAEPADCPVYPLVNPRKVQNWLHYRNMVESVCRAAKELMQDYDLGIGIAKKGLWLSFLFSSLGLPTYDIVIVRDEDARTYAPMDKIRRESLEGKRILVFDNDAITGDSLAVIPEALQEKGISYAHMDLLLLHRYSHISEDFYQEVKDRLVPGQHLGKTDKGKRVIDSLLPVPKAFRKKMTIENDFNGRRKDLRKLKAKMGV